MRILNTYNDTGLRSLLFGKTAWVDNTGGKSILFKLNAVRILFFMSNVLNEDLEAPVAWHVFKCHFKYTLGSFNCNLGRRH